MRIRNAKVKQPGYDVLWTAKFKANKNIFALRLRFQTT
jgi:hypothetical protein